MRPVKEDGKVILKCTNKECLFEKGSDKTDFTLKTNINDKKKKEIVVIDEDKELENLSTIDAECPKCKHEKAIWWLVQTRGVDEPSTRFFRCVKCRHTWREYA